MEVNLDEDDDLAFVHTASGKCDACTHLLHYIPTTPQTYGPWSFFKVYLSITNSDEVNDIEENDGDDSFFTSKLVAEDLDCSEGMLLVNVILRGANSITHLILWVGLQY